MSVSIESLQLSGKDPLAFRLADRSWESFALMISFAALFFGGLERVLALGIPKHWIKSQFKAAGKVESKDLDHVFWQATCRIVGMVHLIIQIPLGLIVLWNRKLRQNPIYATADLSVLLTVISSGYFCYDLYVCVFRWEGSAYLLHGFTCCTLYCYCALTGYLHYFAGMFLMWELSTPFVYARWLLYNLNLAGSRLYVANGLLMLAAFFSARNVLGLYMLITFFRATGAELSQPSGAMSPVMLWVYRVACITLTGLNGVWFYKMLLGAIRVVAKSKNANSVEQEITES